ncbi:MAG TPA: hypothetical protein PKY30_02395 [Myxococcota bacterium]|nr:hypothetical protein [Myxococcota bacterium]
MLFLWVSHLLAAPIPLDSSAEEALARGELVIRALPEENPGMVRVVGVAEISATVDQVWSSLLDFSARLKANPALRAMEPYLPPTPSQLWLRFTVSTLGFTVVYHNQYWIDKAAGTLVHQLDPSRPNDLQASRGEFELQRPRYLGSGVRLQYLVETSFGQAIPAFVQSWMVGGGLRDFMADIVTRAEGK